MNEGADNHIGNGLAWMGFWLMIGLANFGESPINGYIDAVKLECPTHTEIGNE